MNLYVADASGNPTGTILKTNTTSNGGYYLFDYLETGSYVVVIPDTEFGSGGTLEGYWSSGTSRDGTGSVIEILAPDPDIDTDDSDDNGNQDDMAHLEYLLIYYSTFYNQNETKICLF